jgi:anti-sigma regulatory factor (Ser/Thr protein kinase)
VQTTMTQQRPASPAWEMWFTPYERSVALARAEVGRTLTRWGYAGDSVDSVTLVISELVTNAIIHGGGQHLIHVQLTVAAGNCLVEVSDACGEKPAVFAPGPDGEHGRGLLLVAALAADHGVRDRQEAEGKTVWARMVLEAPC